MAQKFEEMIKVKYQMIENGVASTKECRLIDIPEQDKEGIISLAVFPILNKDNSENKVVKDISKYIANFPMLQTVSYPKQFSSINVGLIQKNGCPNLHQVVRTIPQGYEGKSSLMLKGAKTVNSSIDTSTEVVSSFASILPDDQNAINIIDVPVKSASTEKTAIKSIIVDKDNISKEVKKINQKLEDIAGRIGRDNVPTGEQIEGILDKFVGTLTESQLSQVIEAVQNININVATSALEGVVEKTIKDKISALYNKDNSQFNKSIQDFISNIENMRNDNKSESEMYDYVRDNLSTVLASDKNLRIKLLLVDGVVNGNNEEANGLVNDTLAHYFELLTQDASLSAEGKENISKLLGAYAQDLFARIRENDNPLLDEILAKTPSDKKIDRIVEDTLVAHRLVDNDLIRTAVVDKITGTILQSMGGFDGKVNGNMDNIQAFVEEIIENDEFVNQLTKIAQDSDLNRCANIAEVKSQINRNHSEEISEIANFVSDIVKIPVKKDIKDELSKQTAYILRRIGLDESAENESLLGLLNIRDKENDEHLQVILDECRNNQMSVDDVKQFLMSNNGKELLASALGVKAIENALAENNQKLDSAMDMMQQFKDSIKELTTSGVGSYVSSQGLTEGVMMGGNGIANIPNGYNATISRPFEYPENSTQNLDQYINKAIKFQLNNMFGTMGASVPNSPDPHNTKDEIINKLNKENEEMKKQIVSLKDAVIKSAKIIEEMNKAKTVEQKANETKTENAVETATEQKKDDKKVENKAENKEEKKDPKTQISNAKIEPSIKLPEPKKETFKGKSVEMMDMLAEPKMSRAKKFKKWLKRHPLALTACGIGAGALLGAGYGVFAAGGISSLISTAMYFIPTLKTIGIGAAIGLGAGAVGEVVGRVAGLGKKDRLYNKFLKEKAKCDAYKQSLELIERAIENERSAIESSIDNMKSCKKLKQLNRYKKANMSKAKNLSKLRSKQRELKGKYQEQVEKFLEAKRELNDYEDKKGKTMAMGGNLQELRKARAKAQEEMENAEDEEEKDIIKEQLDTEEKIIDASAGKKVSALSSNFKTGDAEAYDMLKNIKSKSKAMNDIMSEIENRNSKQKETSATVEVYDKEDIVKYAEQVKKSGNEADKNNLKALLVHAQETNKKASETLQLPEDKLAQLLEAKKKFEQSKNANSNTSAKTNDNEEQNKDNDGIAR